MLILNSRFAAETFDLNHYFWLGAKRGHAKEKFMKLFPMTKVGF